MELLELFEKAKAESTNLAQKPSNESLLQLYALYKQATMGDVQTEAPANPFDFVGKAKFEAWQGLKGLSREKAMEQYIQLVEKLKG
jgi:acyl-CoA-binding protein